jgi:hypothetical protein
MTSPNNHYARQERTQRARAPRKTLPSLARLVGKPAPLRLVARKGGAARCVEQIEGGVKVRPVGLLITKPAEVPDGDCVRIARGEELVESLFKRQVVIRSCHLRFPLSVVDRNASKYLTSVKPASHHYAQVGV